MSMLRRMLTVGGFTLVSRVTGFARDIMLAAILGAGPVADAFFVALRLPNHFRAIFAEGAFNAAFVPAYARVREQGGAQPAQVFADRIFTLLLISQLVLLAAALAFTPAVIGALAPGFETGTERYALAVDLTRITFPYLLLVSIVTLYSGILNALSRFASAAAAPILLNLSMMMALALAAFFPTAGHAAAWGVLAAGVLEALLVGGDALRQGALPRLKWPTLDAEVRSFFRRFGPATIGSAGTQIALFADTIIASFLAAGAVSALYYADRINQLPIGVIGIAAGTVLLPEMARRIAAGDEGGARIAQNRAIGLTVLLTIPCLVAFVLIPDLIMRALFSRGAFTATDAANAADTLRAYAVGLLPFVLMRSATVTFLSRGDTVTPVKALFCAVLVNVALKVALMGPLAQVGLALATAAGAWINLLLLWWLAHRRDLFRFDPPLRGAMMRVAVAGVLMAAVVFSADRLLATMGGWMARDEFRLLLLALLGGLSYGISVLVLIGRRGLRTMMAPPPSASVTTKID